MVEYIEDTIGPSPLMEDQERRCWDLVVGSGDLVDARLCASMTKGPHFTRQAWKRWGLALGRLRDILMEEKARISKSSLDIAQLEAKLTDERSEDRI
ncbi:hypothetical protein R1sor_024465 [Riccia sorocarpa]|uniref:Uncharacterized protein n=1 Tax=Riccia sorocarpa TaxID=122646 RepID=A0ABD3GT14_9MARC